MMFDRLSDVRFVFLKVGKVVPQKQPHGLRGNVRFVFISFLVFFSILDQLSSSVDRRCEISIFASGI